ncbi:MAG TPA: transglycosylase SLT domain-containing protein [Acidobacteriaceae bacterium]|nr:transglycosylase SLT domain-containing protein [Acidobacteriaceae bacterium]
MAQQLYTLHSPAAYAGVERYARTHTGEAAGAAYLALGNAYLADHRYPDATAAFLRAHQSGQALADYADYLGAQADFAQQQYTQAGNLLIGFDTRHPDSILVDRADMLLAKIYVAQGDPQNALKQLALLDGTAAQNTAEYILSLAHAREMAGNRDEAIRLYTRLYTDYPTSDESTQAVTQLHQMGLATPFTMKQRVRHAEGLSHAHNYVAAADQYRSLAADPSVAGTAAQNLYLAKAALNDFFRIHHVDVSELAGLSDTNDEAGAMRLYLMMESARDRSDAGQVHDLVQQMQQRFATSGWTAEALFSAGNMALLANDMPTAIQYYSALSSAFPSNAHAEISHWHAAWLNYRIGDKKTAAHLFEEQILQYPDSTQTAAALYWRGRIYQDTEKNAAAAAACYHKLILDYQHYYYADLARQQLAGLHDVTAVTLPLLAALRAPHIQTLSVDVPEDDEHVVRAELLANAGLNQYIAPEIQASPDSSEWGGYAEAQLYASYGETFRALHVLKRTVHSYFSIPITDLPRGYWTLLFPQPYWPALVQNAKSNGLDPYLVASLIRQESEFNPAVVSYANAYGLMQLLPRVGSELARNAHVRPFRTAYLLNPAVNLRLGTVYLRQLLDEFNGQTEYALAAYNAGDDRVKSWMANGPYTDMPEFVESIPFTQTREYVQAILRNAEIYRMLYANGAHAADENSVASK